MKVFHDSRDISYRAPFGAIAPGDTVTLAVDVFDVPNATVTLRTWFDGVGETLYEMSAVGSAETAGAADDVQAATGATANTKSAKTAGATDATGMTEGAQGDDQSLPMRYQVSIAPEANGIVWYHFIVTDGQGNQKRYGAQPGRVGGAGELFDWEPPSFQLTVHEPRDMPPAWHEMIGAYLYNNDVEHTLDDIMQTIRENFPASVYQSAYPWRDDPAGMADAPSWSPWPALSMGENGKGQPSFPGSLFAVNDDVFGFWSHDDADNLLCTLVNTSRFNTHDVAVPLTTDRVSELIGGYGVRIVGNAELEAMRRDKSFYFNGAHADGNDGGGDETPADGADGSHANDTTTREKQAGTVAASSGAFDRYVHVRLHPLGTCVLHFHANARLQQPMEAGLGVLAHITSLPAESVGTLGEPAKEFVDWLAQAGARYWQVLPVSPTDEYGSPYAGISAFAGNIRLLEGYTGSFADPSPTPRAYAKVAKLKKYQQFCERESDWLEPYAAFMAIRQKLGDDLPWQKWPKKYRRFNPAVIAKDEKLAAAAEAWRQAQYQFEQQWSELHAYANERGVLIVGDMPIYVSADSADAWAHPDIFQLDSKGMPVAVAGCAPDAFAADGQVWGNPLYDWDACRANGYDWWLRRLKRAFELYDVVRLDHFIGFSRYYSIPAGEDAAAGTYLPGPGVELFQLAYEQHGPLPVIAEDLGLITPAVRSLSASCGFPGMDIVQFVDGNDPLSGYWPRPDKIAYTGTHDNQTLVGYCRERYPHMDARIAARDIMEKVATCSAPVCVVPLQDLMELGDEARMNVPGVAEGNWAWQADANDLQPALEQARNLVALHAKTR